MGLYLMGPTHQQYGRVVVFMLFSGGAFTAFPDSTVILPINPEEFTLQRPERVSVVQTLGDPFVDEFGTGLTTINIRGTTGWRTRLALGSKIGIGAISTSTFGINPGVGVAAVDGYEAYRQLHREIFDTYFSQRKEMVRWGRDPDEVNLILLNTVDNLAFNVVPTEFRLLRSRSRPQLYQYDLNFTVREDLSEQPAFKYTMQAVDLAQTVLMKCVNISSGLSGLGANFTI